MSKINRPSTSDFTNKPHTSGLHIMDEAEAEVDGVYIAIDRTTHQEVDRQAFKQGEIRPEKWKGRFVDWQLIHQG